MIKLHGMKNINIIKAENCASARRRLLLDYSIPAYDTLSWNWNWKLEYTNWEYAYVNGFGVFAEGLDMFRLGTVATCGKMKPSGNLSFKKRTVVG
jgi:hypothetical protein